MPGLDGGTYITRSDVLRGQSWNVATADDSRSRRGGYVSSVYKPKTLTSAEHRYDDGAEAICYSSDQFICAQHTPHLFSNAPHLFSYSNVVLSTCALSGARLTPPIVGDLLGALYNRTAVLEYVLAVRHASFSDDAAQVWGGGCGCGGVGVYERESAVQGVEVHVNTVCALVFTSPALLYTLIYKQTCTNTPTASIHKPAT